MKNDFKVKTNENNKIKNRILINASTFQNGGAIQVGISFIEFVCRRESIAFDFLIVVSTPLYNNLTYDLQQDERIIVCPVSPASIIGGHKSRRMLKKLEADFLPDIIYSISFPSYTRFKIIEVGRFTNPWQINQPPLPWHTLSLKMRVITYLGRYYRLYWAARAKYFETQIESAKSGIIRKLGVPENRVKVIPNCPNFLFFSNEKPLIKEHKNDRLNIFCLSPAYPHKNLPIIPEVAHYLKNNFKIDCNFILTIPSDGSTYKNIEKISKRLDVNDMIQNVGTLKLIECVEWYNRSDIVFLPTLLEVFSATYVEAMAMSKPIVTTDLSFAHEVCGEAALYYSPNSAKSAAETIMMLIDNPELRYELVDKGKKQLAKFPDPDTKHHMVLDWLAEIISFTKS